MPKDPRILEISVRFVFAICTPVLLLLSNLYLLATPAFIRYEYGKPSFPPADRYDAVERLSLAEATLYYMRSEEGTDYLMGLQSSGRSVYNSREIKHLVDARLVMRGALWVQATCSALFLVAVLFSVSRKQIWPQALRSMCLGCLSLVALLIAIGVFAYANFGLFFTIFHRLLFEGNSWLFAFSDTLIQLFPLQLWMDATWLLAAATVMECTLAGVAACILYRRRRPGR